MFLLEDGLGIESEPQAGNCKLVKFMLFLRLNYGVQDESALRMLLRLGYENEVFYLIVA